MLNRNDNSEVCIEGVKCVVISESEVSEFLSFFNHQIHLLSVFWSILTFDLDGAERFCYIFVTGESVLSVLSATSVDIWHYNHNISQDNFIRCQFTAVSHRAHNSQSSLFYHYCLLQKQSFHSRLSHSTISITLQRNGTVLRNDHKIQDHFWSFLSYC